MANAEDSQDSQYSQDSLGASVSTEDEFIKNRLTILIYAAIFPLVDNSEAIKQSVLKLYANNEKIIGEIIQVLISDIRFDVHKSYDLAADINPKFTREKDESDLNMAIYKEVSATAIELTNIQEGGKKANKTKKTYVKGNKRRTKKQKRNARKTKKKQKKTTRRRKLA